MCTILVDYQSDLAVKRPFAFLMRLEGFDSFLIKREFELTLMEHDADGVWNAIEKQVRSESHVAILIPGYTGYARETFIRFLDWGMKEQKDAMLSLLDEILTKFRDASSVSPNLHELEERLKELGYMKRQLSAMELCTRPVKVQKEKILADAKPYEAYKEIERIIRRCRNQLAIMDPWVDEDIFPLYLESVRAPASIRIITQHMTGKFEAVAKKFSKQRKQFEVRLHDIHDRYIIVDDRAWLIGQSIKDAGKRPLAIIELGDVGQAKALFDKIWSTGRKAI